MTRVASQLPRLAAGLGAVAAVQVVPLCDA
jgi:hypothetical protein